MAAGLLARKARKSGDAVLAEEVLVVAGVPVVVHYDPAALVHHRILDVLDDGLVGLELLLAGGIYAPQVLYPNGRHSSRIMW